jgi:hypothetical protein
MHSMIDWKIQQNSFMSFSRSKNPLKNADKYIDIQVFFMFIRNHEYHSSLFSSY